MRGRARKTTDRYKLDQCALYRTRGLRGLANLLFTGVDALEDLARRQSELYAEWDIETRPGKIRHIEHPARPLKEIQARIETLLMRLEPPLYLFCPVKGRDFLMNALRHQDRRAIWRVDVKDYFASTQSGNVLKFFRDRLGCAGDVATVLTKLTTYRGHLPTGSPLSPVLSFFANEPMWEEIRRECAEFNCEISLYMDDLTVSGHDVPWSLRATILRILNRNGFKGHKAKFAVARPTLVTGLITGSVRPTLPHSHFKKFREQMKRVGKAETPEEHARLIASINGMMRLRHLAGARTSRARSRATRNLT